jgi:hypothetical protein
MRLTYSSPSPPVREFYTLFRENQPAGRISAKSEITLSNYRDKNKMAELAASITHITNRKFKGRTTSWRFFVAQSVYKIALRHRTSRSTEIDEAKYEKFLELSTQYTFEVKKKIEHHALRDKIAGRKFRLHARGNISFNVYTPRGPGFPFVVKIPHDFNPQVLKESIHFAKKYMGGIIPAFSILWDMEFEGSKHAFIIVQKRLREFRDHSTLPPELQEAEKNLLLKLVTGGIWYGDALIPFNYGQDQTSGQLYLVDFGTTFLTSRKDAFRPFREPNIWGGESLQQWNFYKGPGYRPHFDEIGLPPDDVLSELWATKRHELRPVPDINL